MVGLVDDSDGLKADRFAYFGRKYSDLGFDVIHYVQLR